MVSLCCSFLFGKLCRNKSNFGDLWAHHHESFGKHENCYCKEYLLQQLLTSADLIVALLVMPSIPRLNSLTKELNEIQFPL